MRPPELEPISRVRTGDLFSYTKKSPASPSRRGSWIVLALIALLYVAVSFAPVIFDDNEGLYAASVREMHEAHNWLVPLSNGFPRVQKPPLVYWTMLVSTTLLGENEFALRLPNALATVGWIVATYLLMRRVGGERFGLTSAAALASMLGVWIFTHLVQPEPFLACFVSLALWCLVEARFEMRPAARWYWLCWMFLGLGAMSKGLHGALWPLGVVGLLAGFFPTWRPWLRPLLSLRGVLIFAVIVVPWYAYMAAKFPHFLSAHFVNEQMGAALNARYPSDARQLPLLQFYGQHLLFWMPWTLLLPGAIWAALRVAPKANDVNWTAPEIDAVRLLECWVVLVLVSVAFSMRQDYYSMSCWGVVAGFLIFPWTLRQAADVHVPRWFLLGPCLLLAVVGVAALVFATHLLHPATSAALAAPIAERDTFMDALSGISPNLWNHLIVLFFAFGGALLIGGCFASYLVRRGQNSRALLMLAGTMAVPVVLATCGFTIMSPYFSLEQGARGINRELAVHPDALVACEAAPNTASSLIYYLNARIHWVNAPFDNQYAQHVLGLGHDYYWNDAGLESAWHAPTPVFLIVEDDRLPYWRARLAPVRLLAREGTRDVLVNR
jgi:4-amino-4-deoxy-L-arabinose transferase-like glycosyltransferase